MSRKQMAKGATQQRNTMHVIRPKPVDRMLQTEDGFINLVQRSGLGAANTYSAGTYAPVLLTRNRQMLEWMYRGGWIIGAAVDAIPQDMTRAGIEIHSEDEPSDIAKLQRSLVSKGVWKALTDNLRWGRLYGGSVALIDIDGQDPASPLKPSTVGKDQFNGLRIYDRWSLAPDLNHLVASGRDAGLPEWYTLTSMDAGTGASSAQNGVRFHYTRVIRSIGIQLPLWQAITESLWGESVLERMLDRITAFDTASMGVANLIDRAYLRTVKVEGLREILSAGGVAEANLRKTMDAMRLMQSNEGVTLVDSKDEVATYAYSYGGLDDVILQFAQQLAGAIGIPMSRLFGQAPKGLNATGEGDMRIYHENIAAAQEDQLRDGVMRILGVAYRSLFGRDLPDDFDFDFRPLAGMTDLEKSTITQQNSASIIAAFDSGVIDQPVAMRELQTLSMTTGVFTNITDDDVKAAEEEPPPAPQPVTVGAPIAAGVAAPEAEPTAAPTAEAAAMQEESGAAATTDARTVSSGWRRWLTRG